MISPITSYISNAGGRERNEDRCGYWGDKHASCWIVADGLGGHQGGEEASEYTVKSITEAFKKAPLIEQDYLLSLFEHVSQNLFKIAQRAHAKVGFFSTAVGLFRLGESVVWLNLGDSRLYHFQYGKIKSITRDHSVPRVLVDLGEISFKEIRGHPDRHRLLRTMGVQEPAKPDIYLLNKKLSSADQFLLCTDGFWEKILEEEIEHELKIAHSPAIWLKQMEKIIRARMTEDEDNYSAIAVWIEGDQQGMLGQLYDRIKKRIERIWIYTVEAFKYSIYES